jgi:hypothetical protein
MSLSSAFAKTVLPAPMNAILGIIEEVLFTRGARHGAGCRWSRASSNGWQ